MRAAVAYNVVTTYTVDADTTAAVPVRADAKSTDDETVVHLFLEDAGVLYYDEALLSFSELIAFLGRRMVCLTAM